MEIIVENTGAQRGAIILDHGTMLVRASKQHDAPVAVSEGTPLAGVVSEGIVMYVARTSESVVLAEASRHRVFRTDPYVRERQTRSVLCFPIVHKERLLGVVYLENNLIAGAFSPERLETVGILAGQLAISIDNAVMFARLADYREHLEDLVAERTRELREEAAAREHAESELRLAHKLQAVGQLAAGIAHEINTPIQYVGDSITFLSEAFDALLAGDHDDLEYIRANAPAAFTRALDGIERVTKIVRAMKTFSHPDKSEQSPASLNEAIENTLVVAHNEYREVADVVTELGAIPPVTCHVGEINQVVLNLVINAAHAIEDTNRRGRITVRTYLDGADAVCIAISDTGGGVPETVRDRIFDPFFTTKVVGRGTGQGLALARTAVVDRHGGSLTFDTQLGEGTTFYVRLPVRRLAA
jgi:signal transduction histidine kinase